MNLPKDVQLSSAKPTDSPARLAGSARIGVLVMGMHRSGTSALTRVLNLLGCTLPHTLLGANDSNPQGHWESDRIWRFNDELLALAGSKWDDWLPIGDGFFAAPGYPDLIARGAQLLREEFAAASLFVFKDPRNARLARFWLDVFAADGISPAVVIPIRNPLEVARSLHTRNSADEHYGALVWLRHVLDAEAVTRGRARVFTSYQQMIDCWQVVAGRIQQGLGITWPRMSPMVQEEIDIFIDKRHRRESVPPNLVEANPVISGWLRRAWRIFEDWALSEEKSEDHAELDTIRQALNEATPAFARLLLHGDLARRRVAELEDELQRFLDEAQARAEHASAQLQEATDRLTQYADRIAEQESALAQRREENAQAWTALSLEQAASAELRDRLTELAHSQESQREQLARSEAWVFRLAEERRAAQNQARIAQAAQAAAERARQTALEAKAAAEQARHTAEEARRETEAQARLASAQCTELERQQTEHAGTLAKMAQSLHGSQDRVVALQGELQTTQTRLGDRFREIAQLSRMQRDNEHHSDLLRQQADWFRQLCLAMQTAPRWWLLLPQLWRSQLELERLRRKGLFDGPAYLARHPDVRAARMDPLRHYIRHGLAEGRSYQ